MGAGASTKQVVHTNTAGYQRLQNPPITHGQEVQREAKSCSTQEVQVQTRPRSSYTKECQTEPWNPGAEREELIKAQNIKFQDAVQEVNDLSAIANADPADPEDVWLRVDETLDVPKGEKNPNANLVVKRSGWKTIRVFVSSTFKDFHYEREVLVKEVSLKKHVWSLKPAHFKLRTIECQISVHNAGNTIQEMLRLSQILDHQASDKKKSSSLHAVILGDYAMFLSNCNQ